ncbi:MAG: 1-deoxy-D-xylulose-5-phosphate synthase [Rikenellaceae bacterium]|nr:1-deoxy-D-xylulose-5-phosphate synthase [Rikenellaceae bacterium]
MSKDKYNLLTQIDSPSDLKRLPTDLLPQYCDEVRRYIVECCAENPGHLASSLGAVELAVALHYVYNTPDDRIVWDVGHQAYAHKIITGRRDRFVDNRKQGGLSGFLKMAESEYDAFGSGHASVSISAALGMAKASELKGESRKVVAVIGDGSMTGGLAFEGLNNAGDGKNCDILVILNDNNMAIDEPTGALGRYLTRVSTSRFYNRFKSGLWRILGHVPFLLHLCRKVGNMIKQGLMNNSNLFESLNFRYFGRIDGNNVKELVRTLTDLRDISGPKLLHIMTLKGKGYAPAEKNPTEWHAPGRFDATTGERVKSTQKADKYQDVFGQTLLDLARIDERVVGITPAMPSGCSMTIMMEQMPERCFDVGIAEGHAVTFSAGLATEGVIPFCNIYSTFMQRAYDNVIHDVALQNLPVVMCLDRGGLVGEDGATHHGAFDLAYFGCIPNIVIAAPSNERELRNMMFTALSAGCPFVIRYPRGCGEGVEWRECGFELLPIGKGVCLKGGKDIAILTVGTTASSAAKAIALAAEQGLDVAHYDLRFAKPLDEELLHEVGKRFKQVITVEDGILRGGVGEAVSAFFNRNDYDVKVRTLGIDDRFVEQGTPAELYAECGYDTEGILKAIEQTAIQG